MPGRQFEQLFTEQNPKPNRRARVGEAKESTTVAVTGKLQAWTVCNSLVGPTPAEVTYDQTWPAQLLGSTQHSGRGL